MIKLDHNWKHKTLEKLKNEFWGLPTFDSHLVTRTDFWKVKKTIGIQSEGYWMTV